MNPTVCLAQENKIQYIMETEWGSQYKLSQNQALALTVALSVALRMLSSAIGHLHSWLWL